MMRGPSEATSDVGTNRTPSDLDSGAMRAWAPMDLPATGHVSFMLSWKDDVFAISDYCIEE